MGSTTFIGTRVTRPTAPIMVKFLGTIIDAGTPAVMRGDSYLAVDGRAFRVPTASPNGEGGGTFSFSALERATGVIVFNAIEAARVFVGGQPYFQVELSAAQTMCLTAGSGTYKFIFQQTLPDGDPFTVAVGYLTVMGLTE